MTCQQIKPICRLVKIIHLIKPIRAAVRGISLTFVFVLNYFQSLNVIGLTSEDFIPSTNQELDANSTEGGGSERIDGFQFVILIMNRSMICIKRMKKINYKENQSGNTSFRLSAC